MSEQNLTLEEAASVLQVTPRTLRTYIKQGALHATRIPGSKRKVIAAADVYALREAKQGTALNVQKTLALLQAKIQRLEARCSVLERILDAKDAPLAVDAAYGAKLYSLCAQQLAVSGWSTEEMSGWAEVFLRLQEEDLKVLNEATDDPKPWLPFLRLSVRMIHFVLSASRYKESLELQQLHLSLAEGRRRLRTAAVIYAESRGIADPSIAHYSAADVPRSVGDLLVGLGKGRK